MGLITSAKRKFSFSYKGKIFILEARDCSMLRKGIGLMFRTRGAGNLLFSFNRDVKRTFTGLFVFFPFLIVWFDSRNRITGFRLGMPFEPAIIPKRRFRKALELPLNKQNSKIIEYFVGKAKI